MSESRKWDNEPETPAESRFFNLRESGYTSWIDKDGYPTSCPCCGSPNCTADLTEPCT